MDMTGDLAHESLLDRIPPDVADSFTPEQRAALWNAAKPISWRRHPVNIRLSFPLVGGRYFLTIVGGVEKRSDERRRRERLIFPLRTAGNLLFLLGIGGGFTIAALVVVLVFSNLIQF